MDRPDPEIRYVWRPRSLQQQAFIEWPGFEAMYGGSRGGGKCLPLDEPVLTPFGWKAMGDIHEGMQVCSPDGSVSRVIAVYRPGVKTIYDLKFSDGASVRCDEGHIWLGKFVGNANKRDFKHKLFTTKAILERLERCPDTKFLIPLTKPVAFTRPRNTKHGDMRPVDPYVLGVLLGDGNMTNGVIRYATVDPEIDEEMAKHGELRVDEGPNRRLVYCPELKESLERLGCWGKYAYEKRVPTSYLWASEGERWAILQGLMDTDGTADDRGQCYFASSSEGLAEDVQFLARSLGFKATKWSKQTTHRDCYQVYLRGPRRADLFRLARKKERAEQPFQSHHSCRRLVSAEVVGESEVGCFQVDNPNGLFITKDFIVTHNTDGSLGLNAIRAGKYRSAYRGLFLRKHLTDLEDAISRAKEIYLPIGAEWHEQKKRFTFPGGGELSFAYLKADKDAEKYQGRNLTDVSIEELTQVADPKPIFKLMASMRSAQGVPPQFRATCNPGGPGHHWVKSRYIDPAPLGFEPIIDQETGLERVFIPSRVWDNKALMESDPGYINRIKMSAGGSEALIRAWLYGDWDSIEGAYFDNWSAEKHVIRPFTVPKHWMRFRSMDWGSAVPFCVLWFAVSDGEEFKDHHGEKLWFPRGALIVYREYYGMPEGKPNIGLKLTAEEICKGGKSTVDGQHYDGILDREKGDEIKYGVASPDMFKQDGGPSVAERMALCDVIWMKADNRRVARNGAIGGWDQVRSRLNGIDDRPMLYVFSTCTNLIRTLPVMQHDPDNMEDMADGEDHAVEGLRYGCMSRPWTTDAPVIDDLKISTKRPTFNQAVKSMKRRSSGIPGRI